jgi:uncharacterized protein YdhG (YjbR/CyaY superfamily)
VERPFECAASVARFLQDAPVPTPSKSSPSAKSSKRTNARAKKPTTIDGYLATVDRDRREALEKLRKTIRSIVPDAVECISYGIPAFRLERGIVAGFCATTKGCSYFPFSGKTLDTVADEIAEFSRTKSALHFDAKIGLRAALVRKLIRVRIAEMPKAR